MGTTNHSMRHAMRHPISRPVARPITGESSGGSSQSLEPLLATEGIEAAYGVSLLVPSYSGNCVDLRRLSDNAESSFGLVGGKIDPAVKDWLSGGLAWVVKFYDQSGNGNHLVESVSANCPVYSPTILPEGIVCWNQAVSGTMLHVIPTSVSVTAQNFAVGFFGMLQGLQATNLACFLGASPWVNLFSSGGLRVFEASTGAKNSSVYPQSYPDAVFYEGTDGGLTFDADGASQTIGTMPGATTYTGGQFGTGIVGGSSWSLCATGFAIFNEALGAEKDAIRARLKIRYDVPSEFTGLDLLAVGDSLTDGYGSNGRSWPVQFLESRGGISASHWTSSAGSGATTSAMSSYPLAGFFKSSCARHVCVILGGTNDLRIGVTPATSLANIATIVSNAQAAGYEVYVCTVPAGAGVNNTDRATLNSAILSAYGASAIDLAADARLSVTTDTTYYLPDELHFNATGYGVFASLIGSVVG